MSSMPGQLGGAPLCPVCSNRVYFNEGRNFMANTWHIRCFRCVNCSKMLESGTANLLDDGNILCNNCHRNMFATKKTSSQIKQQYVNCDDPECCPRCGKRVYFAEQVLSLGRKWHKMCLSCASCKKHLDVSSVADHNGEVFCRSCHTRLFGPKGYGFAGGAGTGLSMDTGCQNVIATDNIPQTAKAYMAPALDDADGQNGTSSSVSNGTRRPVAQRWGGGEYCHRCNKQVFLAEKRHAAGCCYHEKCFTCSICNKKLDSTKLAEKDSEIFCKACYGRKFGPKGYGYGIGGGTLQMT